MRLARWEWRKLFRLPALWGFLGLCLAFNCLLMADPALYERDFFNQTSDVTGTLGQRVDEDFIAGLSELPPSELRDFLFQTATDMEDIFETYETKNLMDFYTDIVSASPLAIKWMTWKYDLLSHRVEHLAETDAAMDLYAGPTTHDSHQFLFGTLFHAILGEAAILAMLGTLYLLGYEGLHQTEALACASRVGRKLWHHKVLAAVLASIALYVLVAAPTLGIYFTLFDYGGIWGASVSSQFNYFTDMLFTRPFLTWSDFTVAGYLAAALALGGALTVTFSMLAALCGSLVRNTYLAALVVGVICFGGLFLTSALGELEFWAAYLIACFQPMLVWLCCNGWFTEMGLSAVLPWQETIAVGIDLLVLGVGTVLALHRFNRKDVA